MLAVVGFLMQLILVLVMNDGSMLSLAPVLFVGAENDLYKVLGVHRRSTAVEIRKAYRQKAKDTHPDKNPGVDPDVAAERFRVVADAYEVLSDERLRRQYDQTGSKPGDNQRGSANRNQRNNNNNQNDWFWNFHNNFGHQKRDFRFGRQQQQQQKGHKFLRDHYLRPKIKDAQARTLAITGLPHLQFISLNDEDRSDRYILLAIYDSRVAGCEDFLNLDLLFPFPYAGYTNDGDRTSESNVWWDEIMLPVKIDLKDNTGDSEELRRHFGVPKVDPKQRNALKQCATIVVINRGETIHQFSKISGDELSDHSKFQSFVWGQLRMKVFFVNKSKFTVQFWWLDGLRGKDLGLIEPNQVYASDTFLTHSFYFRANFVEGMVLTNESALLWYTARSMSDDNKEIHIVDRCFDHHGDCTRWKQEGFCDPTRETYHTARNPSFRSYVMSHCFVSCQVGCGKKSRGRGGNSEL